MRFASLVLAFAAFFSASLHAAIGPVRMEIEQHSATKLPKATPGRPPVGEKTQHRSLTIKLSNRSDVAIGSLVVKYFFLGHDMKDHNITVLRQGERKSSLAARGKETVESEEVTSAYTDAHTEAAKGKGKGTATGKGRATTKKVQASGKKITGYAVLVLNGAKVEAEYYSEPSYKEKVKAAVPSAADAPSISGDPVKTTPPKKAPPKKKKK